MNDLQNYLLKRRLRSCVRRTCEHEFCQNSRINIKELQPTQAEKLAYNEYYRQTLEKNPLSKKSTRLASKNWKLHNAEKHAATQKQWADNNQDKIREINRKHREKMKKRNLK